MRSSLLLLLLCACPSASPLLPDASGVDSGSSDTGAADAASEDADLPDAGEADADAPDLGTTDAGPDCAFGAADTTHLDPRASMPADRLAALELCLAEGANPAAVDAFLAELAAHGGGAPYSDRGEALVFFRGDASRVTVSGSFDGWPSPGQRSFAPIANSDLSVARVPIERGDRHQYKLTRLDSGDSVEWFTDPLNPWVVWDGFDQGTVGKFNNELFGPDHAFASSAIHRFFVRDRDVFVQLPIVHFGPSPPPLGALYVSDGNETLTRAGMQAVVDRTIADGRAPPTAIVYVALPSQDVRFDEYTYGSPTANGDRYVAMLADEIAPLVERTFDGPQTPELRGISGASLGGLISFHAAFMRPDVFRLIGAQSASLFWNEGEMIDRVQSGPIQPIRIYLDSGSPDDNMEVNQQMADVLAARGYDHLHVVEPGAAHEWAFWAGRFDELLEFLY